MSRSIGSRIPNSRVLHRADVIGPVSVALARLVAVTPSFRRKSEFPTIYELITRRPNPTRFCPIHFPVVSLFFVQTRRVRSSGNVTANDSRRFAVVQQNDRRCLAPTVRRRVSSTSKNHNIHTSFTIYNRTLSVSVVSGNSSSRASSRIFRLRLTAKPQQRAVVDLSKYNYG